MTTLRNKGRLHLRLTQQAKVTLITRALSKGMTASQYVNYLMGEGISSSVESEVLLQVQDYSLKQSQWKIRVPGESRSEVIHYIDANLDAVFLAVGLHIVEVSYLWPIDPRLG